MLQATSTATKDEAVNVFFCNLGMVEVLIIGTNISLKLCEWNLSLSLKHSNVEKLDRPQRNGSMAFDVGAWGDCAPSTGYKYTDFGS